MNRPALIKMVHAGARRMGWDEATYRAWMKKHSTQSSCALCSDTELSLLVDLLRDLGALDPNRNAPLPSTGNQERPTQHQWQYALDICRKLGMSGAAHDPALVRFCKKTCKVEHPRFLDRESMSKMIIGLENWLVRRKKAGNTLPILDGKQ